MFFHPPLTALAKYRLQIAFKQGAGILAVLLGIGAGRRYGLKGLVENGHNALLFGERGDGDNVSVQRGGVDIINSAGMG